MADPAEIRATQAKLIAQVHAADATATELAAMLAQTPPDQPDPPPPGKVELSIKAATPGTLTAEWVTDRADPVVIGRDGTDVHGSPAWTSPVLPAGQREFVFRSLRPDTAYTLTLATATGVVLDTVTGRTTRPPVVVAGDHGPRALADGWVPLLAASDNFDGAALDTTRWRPYTDPGSQHGNRQPGQISIVDAAGAMGGRALQIAGSADGRTGGMAHQYSQRFGRWSGRMCVPAGGDPGWHPLLLTWPTAENWSRGGGEIDYSEGECGVNSVNFFLHYGPVLSSGNTAQTHGKISVDITQWNWWEMEWTPDWVRGWCNGVQFFNDTNRAHFNYDAFGAHHGTVQLDRFGANRPGLMLVDVYRVYRHPASVVS